MNINIILSKSIDYQITKNSLPSFVVETVKTDFIHKYVQEEAIIHNYMPEEAMKF